MLCISYHIYLLRQCHFIITLGCPFVYPLCVCLREVVKRTEGNRHSILVWGELDEKLARWDPDKGWAGGALHTEYQIQCYLDFCGFPRHPISAAGIYAPISMKCHKT